MIDVTLAVMIGRFGGPSVYSYRGFLQDCINRTASGAAIAVTPPCVRPHYHFLKNQSIFECFCETLRIMIDFSKITKTTGWKQIPDWPRRYASPCGQILSQCFKPWRVLKQTPNVGGYLCVCFTRGRSERHQIPVHHLILKTFIGEKPDWAQCSRHLDGNKTNNDLSNLAWGTSKQNSADTVAHGAYAINKLTPDNILDVVARRERGETLKSIADLHSVTPATIVYWAKKYREFQCDA